MVSVLMGLVVCLLILPCNGLLTCLWCILPSPYLGNVPAATQHAAKALSEIQWIDGWKGFFHMRDKFMV